MSDLHRFALGLHRQVGDRICLPHTGLFLNPRLQYFRDQMASLHRKEFQLTEVWVEHTVHTQLAECMLGIVHRVFITKQPQLL
jgi:hypothetical protein